MNMPIGQPRSCLHFELLLQRLLAGESLNAGEWVFYEDHDEHCTHEHGGRALEVAHGLAPGALEAGDVAVGLPSARAQAEGLVRSLASDARWWSRIRRLCDTSCEPTLPAGREVAASAASLVRRRLAAYLGVCAVPSRDGRDFGRRKLGERVVFSLQCPPGMAALILAVDPGGHRTVVRDTTDGCVPLVEVMGQVSGEPGRHRFLAFVGPPQTLKRASASAFQDIPGDCQVGWWDYEVEP